MLERIKTIKHFRKARRREMDELFLSALRVELKNYMKANPATAGVRIGRQPVFSFNLLADISRFRYAPVLAFSAVLLLGGGGIILASQNSLPGDALFTVKALTEDVRSALTIDAEAKEKLAVNLAARRIAEIQSVIEQKQADPKSLDIALDRLNEHMDEASKVISGEKDKGKNVSALVDNANENFDAQKEQLDKIFKVQKKETANRVNELKTKVQEAEKTGNDAQKNSLQQQLEKARLEKERLAATREAAEIRLEVSKENIERALENKKGATEAIAESKKKLTEVKEDIAEKGLTVSESDFKQYDSFAAKAEEAFMEERYVEARQHARQASTALRLLEKSLDNEERRNDNINNSQRQNGKADGVKNETTTPETEDRNDNNKKNK